MKRTKVTVISKKQFQKPNFYYVLPFQVATLLQTVEQAFLQSSNLQDVFDG